MKNIYLTSTFRNEWNVKFNQILGEALVLRGISCYLPHRDTDQKSSEEIKFKADIFGIDNSSIILAVAENESPNWGAEIGYAYGKDKKILALKNKEHQIPLICKGMIAEAFEVEDLGSIEVYIDSLVEKVKSLI